MRSVRFLAFKSILHRLHNYTNDFRGSSAFSFAPVVGPVAVVVVEVVVEVIVVMIPLKTL